MLCWAWRPWLRLSSVLGPWFPDLSEGFVLQDQRPSMSEERGLIHTHPRSVPYSLFGKGRHLPVKSPTVGHFKAPWFICYSLPFSFSNYRKRWAALMLWEYKKVGAWEVLHLLSWSSFLEGWALSVRPRNIAPRSLISHDKFSDNKQITFWDRCPAYWQDAPCPLPSIQLAASAHLLA